MNDLSACLVALGMALVQLPYAQSVSADRAVDSINRLIKKEKDPKRLAELMFERALQYPVEAYEQAIAETQNILFQHQKNDDAQTVVRAYVTLGNINHKNKKYQEALKYDSLAVKLAEEVKFEQGKALAHGNIGRELYAMGDIKGGQANYQQALELERSFPEPDVDRLKTYYNQLGVITRILGAFQSSVAYFDEGIALATQQNDQRLLAVLYMNKANTFTETARYDEAVALHIESIRIKEQLKDSASLMQSFNNIANVFKRANEMDKAIVYHRRGIEIATKIGDRKALGLGLVNIAVAYIAKGETDSVASYFNQGIECFAAINDIRGLGLAHHNYGNFLCDEQAYERAELQMIKALEYRTKVGSDLEIGSTLSNLGKLNVETGDLAEAERYLLAAEQRLGTQHNTTYLRDLYSHLVQLYQAKSVFSTASAYQSKLLDIERSMFTENERVNLLKAESKYELERRDLERTIEQEKQRDRLFNILLIAALVVLTLGTVTGILLLRRKQVRERHQAQLQRLAQQHRISTAQALRQVEEEERKKIAGKLHDEVGAMLSIAKLNIDQLVPDVFAADSDATIKLQTAQKLLGDVSETVRGISHTLMPIALEKYGLKPAILDMIRAVNASGKIRVEEVIEGLDDTGDWNNEFCLGLYRIVQEVLNNVIKHAQATHVLVQIVELDNSVTIYMEDNGKGIEKHVATEGVGLKLLKTNIEYLNGAIEISGHENQGTFVLIELPLAKADTSAM
ncbi:ATP-binding protein [Parapedobacter sp. DT-150]|uniref:ATP-binding protein n=1 Tax=Parapedobacter sp. DT-150 TaxID=3396162 RepID=UPI003F1C5052